MVWTGAAPEEVRTLLLSHTESAAPTLLGRREICMVQVPAAAARRSGDALSRSSGDLVH
jgi:hypothetical protein